MSYLLDFVKSLDENELLQFRKLDLLGKEALVRDEYANQAKGFDESFLPVKLQLTKSHFDKTNSVLLDKAMIYFAGSCLKDKLDFLGRKQLSHLIQHELKLTEKKLKKQNNAETLREFYEEAFRASTVANYNNFPVKEIDYYCKAYVRMLDKNEVALKYRILAKREETTIRYYTSRQKGSFENKKSLKNLLVWQRRIKGEKLFEVESRINLGLSAYYEVSDINKSLYYLLEADSAARKVYDKITDRDKSFLLAMLGQQLIVLSRYKEGIEKYEELFSRFPERANYLYHPYQFVFALLIVKDLKLAEQAMKKYIEPFLKNENARNFHFDILRLYAIYHLLNHETELAGNYLQRLLQFSKEDFTPMGDVLFRLVHNVYCVQIRDYALAADVLKKNIKFVDSKSDIDEMIAYKKLFHDLGKVIRFKSKSDSSKKPFPIEELEAGEGRAKLYMDLIRLPLQN